MIMDGVIQVRHHLGGLFQSCCSHLGTSRSGAEAPLFHGGAGFAKKLNIVTFPVVFY
jgi:hypothetical protein